MIGRSRRHQDGLPEQLEALRTAVDLADGRLDPDATAFARHVIDKVDERLKHGTTHTLVAFLGATGSGKSSLTNALVGAEVAPVGLRRPTTSSTLACIWGDADDLRRAGPLLDWLEVDRRHHVGESQSLGGLVLLDVPDHDSVQVEHRLEMERIAELCDLMVWVTDPEKYADAAMHHYLRTLAHHGAVILLVLNKGDLLDEQSLEKCRVDLARLATTDGIAGPSVLAMSADTGLGVDQLTSHVSDAVQENEAMNARLRADITAAGIELREANGSPAATTIHDRSVRRLSAALVEATQVETVIDAVAAGTRRDAAAVMGWPFTRWVRSLRPHPLRRLHLGTGTGGPTSLPAPSAAQTLRADGAIRSFVDEVSADLVSPWPEILRAAATPDAATLAGRLDEAIADGVRRHANRTPRWWSVVGALQVGLAIVLSIGALWLTVLFALGWMQVPDPPTPEWRGWPIPTLMFGFGAGSGLLLAAVARRLAGLSARRAGRRARATAIDNVERMADELVVTPIRGELDRRDRLVDLLEWTGG